MADPIGYYKTQYGRNFTPGQGLPLISTELDSVRAYQFEIHFRGLPTTVQGQSITDLTLAAKKVTGLELGVEPMPVDRVNDKVFYPGKGSPEEISVTFDNLYDPHVANQLWRWFASIYNPVTGKFNGNGGGFKALKLILTQLDAQGQPIMETRMFGVYPTSWKTAEFNYSTNDFHTIEMSFRYDFMEQADADTSIPATTGI